MKEESKIEMVDTISELLLLVEETEDGVLREGLQETPYRATKAWKEWTAGYHQNPEAVLKTFEDGAQNYDGIVIVKNIPFYSKCEHHMADIFGTASFGYIPNKRIVGLSKFSRLLDVFAKRLQVQERLTTQVVEAFNQYVEPNAVGCVITARHMCMESRGVCKQGSETVTSCLRGAFRDNPTARKEFFDLIK